MQIDVDLSQPTERNRLLLVDDEDAVRNALTRLLRREPYEILTAPGPQEALEIVRKTPIGVVMSDHMMPGMLGIDLLREIRRIDPAPLRIMLTAHADLDLAIKAINEGEIYRFFSKPWDDVQLKVDLRLAFDRLNLEERIRILKSQIERQQTLLSHLERIHPGITEVKRDARGAIVIDDIDL